MEHSTILDISSDPVYQELLSSYPETSPEAVETIMQLNKALTFINMRREASFSEYGLTSGRFHLLMLLKRQEPHTLSPSELAKRTGVTRGTMTQFVDAIERDGYVRRVEDPRDRRGMLVELTEAGEAKLKEVLPIHIKKMEEAARALNEEERDMLIHIMNKIVSTYDLTPDPRPGRY